ncbi:alpha/beta fold hydrolase [Actinomarinicola tropica]|uniref:Alpha/beta fold hydrolase n=1 Tax=Actinomarinicola tropica TaxID=2789776 RepID=A0A5Q2RRV6_9ACTN|nr:alpha/beta hydrolase [Actinomarinicola tropica]QGG95925.1 alpha/beta fold hydrolase [Actinomarinicola tropica]
MLLTEGRATVGDIELAYLDTGGDGPLALCLHGFPDTAWGWRHLLPELADAGYRAVAPFMRGYAPSGLAPDGVYQTGALASDAVGLHEALGGDADAVVIGHDWGAPAAYGAANLAPDRFRRVVGAAVPPGGAMARAFLDPAQLRRSWYMFFFQHPLADAVVPMDDLAFIGGLWDDWSPGYDHAEDLAHVRDALGDPAHLAAALGYYRATLGDGPRDPSLDEAQAATGRLPDQPLLYLHGVDDGCVGIDVATSVSSELPDGSRMVAVDGAGHFLQLEQPTIVNELVLSFLAEG